jgi:hypothetical protein
MEHSGINAAILSLTSPGAQAILDANGTIDFARRTNDHVAEHVVARHGYLCSPEASAP